MVNCVTRGVGWFEGFTLKVNIVFIIEYLRLIDGFFFTVANTRSSSTNVDRHLVELFDLVSSGFRKFLVLSI